jgi:prolyl oligopeptidase
MTRPNYPPAERLDVVEVMHGTPVPDPYRWLEDPDDPRTQAWSAAQDALFESARDTWPGRDRYRSRMSELLGAGLVTVPVWRGERQFFMRRRAGEEHAQVLTVDADGTERVLIDPTQLDASGLTTLDSWQPSKEGHLLSYQVSSGGTEESTLHVLDVATGELVDGPIERARYSPIAWVPGGSGFYYARRPPAEQLPAGEEQFHRRVWWHELGTDPDADVEIWGTGLDPHNYYGLNVSMDGRWLVVSAAAGTAPRNDVWVADLSLSDHAHPVLAAVQEGVDAETSLYVGRDGRAYLHTNRDAPRARLMVTTPGDWEYDQWRDLIGERDDAVLDGWAILDGEDMTDAVLVAAWTSHAVGQLTVHDLAHGRKVDEVALPGLGSVSGLSERPEGGHEAWFSYVDHVTPNSVFRFDARDRTTSVWATPPGSVDVPDVDARQVTYESADGTPVRMFVIARTDRPAGPGPTILYGYGGFGASMTPSFSASILTWVEAGGTYAIANLRGGGEEGEDWHRSGMRENKQNVYDDFLSAAQWLVAEGLTTADQLVISGGSNGGLLVGAALTQAPQAFAGVVCSAPLLDMVRYEMFGLGATWNDEYGRADDPTEFGWLWSYSPYHHVQEGTAYPSVLFTIFDGDTRVDPMHARKLAAALQYATTAEAPILVRREANVGHSNRSVSRSVDLSADMLAFVTAVTGAANRDAKA